MSNKASQQQNINANTFPVDSVEPAAQPLWIEPLHQHVAKRFRRDVLFLPDPQQQVINSLHGSLESMTLSPEIRVRMEATLVSLCHPLIEAVATAFSDHRPLALSPDSIWLTIEQGFAHHVTENAEALRHRLVRHENKQELHTRIQNLEPASFQIGIQDFSRQIREASDPVLFETLLCDFSTTTPTIRTASEIVLMDCYSSYFTYMLDCVCGIPKITLNGSVEDWKRIRARVEVLATFDLDWWVSRLRPILDEFVRTAEGHPSLEFWQAIYKPRRAYGENTITGWIADLFPYLGEQPRRGKNRILGYPRRDWIIPVDKGIPSSLGISEPGAEKGIPASSFPSGLASVPITVSFPDRPDAKLDLVAGFFGVLQDAVDMTLSPLISWSVTERAPAQPILI